MIKSEKIEFVKNLKEEVKKYKVVGVMPINGIPDRLVQKVRNGLKADTKMVVARKKLMAMVLEDENHKRLLSFVEGNVVLVLSNKEPMELHKSIGSSRLKLAAKPNQIATSDIVIEGGETSIAPGQAVTELKAAGIDVQIQKGKVIIGKTKVLVPKGSKISAAVSKALKTLDVMPFEAQAALSVVLEGTLLFDKRTLGINRESLLSEVARNFAEAYMLSTEIGLVTEYNISEFIRKAYIGAVGIGLEAKIYEPEIVDKLIASAVRAALQLDAMEKPDNA